MTVSDDADNPPEQTILVPDGVTGRSADGGSDPQTRISTGSREVEPLQALCDLGVLGTPQEAHFDAICRTAKAMFGAPIALMSLIDESRQWFKARCGLALDGTSIELTFCNHAILADEVLVVEDAATDERFRHDPRVAGEPGIRFYAGAPLVLAPGLRIGTLCVIDTVPRSFPPERQGQLRGLATIAVAHLRQHQLRAISENEAAVRCAKEAALAESEARFRNLADNAPVMIWVTEPDGSCSYLSRSWQQFTGQASDEGLGSGWLDAVHPDDRDETRRTFLEANARHEPYRAEYRLRRSDGEYLWAIDAAVPRFGDGVFLGYVGSVLDISERRRSEQALREREEQLRLALEATGLGIWDIDPRTDERHWSDGMRDILGLPRTTKPSREVFLARVHPDDRHRLELEPYPAMPSGGSDRRSTLRIVRADNGDTRWIEIMGQTVTDGEGLPLRLIGTVQDVTARKQAEEALRASEERLRLALQAGRMFAWERDLTSDNVQRSANARELIGLGSGPAADFVARLHPDDRAKASIVMRGEWGGEAKNNELRYIRPDGRMLWLSARSTLFRTPGKPDRLIGVTFDITDRKVAEDDLWRAANQDSLTGLPNRAMFQARFEAALAEAEAEGTRLSLLLVDLDSFKDVNDTLGHDAGDALLAETARRLQAFARSCDTVARLGGDEFAFIRIAPATPGEAVALAERMIARLCEPFTFRDRVIVSRASVGVALFPDDHREARELLKDADLALYRAKAQGRNRVVAYAPEMREATERRVTIAREVTEALRERRLVPFYQPKVNLATGRIVGFEALARWQHPERGALTPAYFGSVFDDPELARSIGDALLAQVALDLRSWLDDGLECGRVAVNLAAAEFADPHLANKVLGLLDQAGLPPEGLEVEVTESVLLGRSTDSVAAILKRFHDQGVRIAFDDFGTGFASLTHLKQFPVDHIKIDQTFVRNLEHDRDDAAIVGAVIGLGRSLGIEVTAEGVETAGQADCLKRWGCDHAQGYHFAKPTLGSRVPHLLRHWHRPAIQAWPRRLAGRGA